METKHILFKSAVKTGLIVGVISIVLALLMYVSNIRPVGIIKPILLGVISLAITIAVLVIFFKKYRNSIGGYISFKDAVIYFLIAMAVSTLISAIYTFVFQQFIDPNHMRNLIEAQKEYMSGYLEGKMSDEQIQATLDKIDQQTASQTAIKQTITSLWSGLLMGGFVALILGAIMKKMPKPFESNNNGVI